MRCLSAESVLIEFAFGSVYLPNKYIFLFQKSNKVNKMRIRHFSSSEIVVGIVLFLYIWCHISFEIAHNIYDHLIVFTFYLAVPPKKKKTNPLAFMCLRICYRFVFYRYALMVHDFCLPCAQHLKFTITLLLFLELFCMLIMNMRHNQHFYRNK